MKVKKGVRGALASRTPFLTNFNTHERVCQNGLFIGFVQPGGIGAKGASLVG